MVSGYRPDPRQPGPFRLAYGLTARLGYRVKLSAERARQVAVTAQLLSVPRPTGMLEVIEHLGGVQMDPIRAVERTERLVLWSRLGAYDLVELDRARFGPNPTLFEYWAFILPLRDFGIHRETMRRRAAATDTTRARYVRDWMAAKASFRRYVLSRLRREGRFARGTSWTGRWCRGGAIAGGAAGTSGACSRSCGTMGRSPRWDGTGASGCGTWPNGGIR